MDEKELERQLHYLDSLFVDKFDNPEIIDALNKIGCPNPVFEEELKNALCRNNL